MDVSLLGRGNFSYSWDSCVTLGGGQLEIFCIRIVCVYFRLSRIEVCLSSGVFPLLGIPSFFSFFKWFSLRNYFLCPLCGSHSGMSTSNDKLGTEIEPIGLFPKVLLCIPAKRSLPSLNNCSHEFKNRVIDSLNIYLGDKLQLRIKTQHHGKHTHEHKTSKEESVCFPGCSHTWRTPSTVLYCLSLFEMVFSPLQPKKS